MTNIKELKTKIGKAHPLIIGWIVQMTEDEELNRLLEANQNRNVVVTLYGIKGKPSKRPRVSFP